MSDSAVDFLRNQIERKKVMSAYLFMGSDGEKKKDLALAFAKAVNCSKNEKTQEKENRFFESCDCPSCHKIAQRIHPDVQWYGMDEDESSIKIEAVRELQGWLALKPYEGRMKVFILNDAGRLTRDAQNALLKSLEEPPPASVLILLAKSKSEFFETVVSRLASVKVAPYEERELALILEKEGASERDARFLARFCGGNLEHARKLAGSSWITQRNDFLKAVLSDSVNGFERLNIIKSRRDLIEFLTILSGWVRDACSVVSGTGREGLLHEDRLKELVSFSDQHSTDELFELFDAIEETKRAVEDNANQKLALARLQVLWHDFMSHAKTASGFSLSGRLT